MKAPSPNAGRGFRRIVAPPETTLLRHGMSDCLHFICDENFRVLIFLLERES